MASPCAVRLPRAEGSPGQNVSNHGFVLELDWQVPYPLLLEHIHVQPLVFRARATVGSHRVGRSLRVNRQVEA